MLRFQKMRVTFSVAGIPPKKDGASSMWRKPSVLPLLKALRTAAAEALADREPLDEPLALTLRISLPPAGSSDLWTRRQYGDLDNFITGVCDGLRAAHPGAFQDEDWRDVPDAARPDRPLAFTDDVGALDRSGHRRRC